MIAIVALMLRHRWRRALTVCLLAGFTYGIAVAVPAFLGAADRAMIGNEIAHATTHELSITAQQPVDVAKGRDRDFELSAPGRLSAPWLDTTFSVAINVDTAPTAPGTVPTAVIPQMVYRQNYCAHVVLLSGRCPLTAREALISPDLATLLHVTAGGQATVWWAYIGANGWMISPNNITVSVVGIYRPADTADPYWGSEGYFTASRTAPILTERGTIDALPHDTEVQNVDAVLRPAALTDATIASRRSWVSAAITPTDGRTVTSEIPTLLTRIDADRQTIREVLPDIAAALILVGCFVLFLTVSHSIADRRVELGVIRLRGVWMPDRWWLGAGESLVPVLVGTPLGLLIGGALATVAGAWTLPGGDSIDTSTGGLLGLVTIGAMLIATAAAHVRPLASPVADLLRRIPARIRGWRSATAQTLVATLAAVAVVQLYLQPGPLTGIMLVAPALMIVALGLLAGPVVLPLAASVGRRSIERPRRLGVGLGALSLSRRTGAHLLLAVQVIAIGLVGFAAADIVAAQHARTEWVALELGAPRVIGAGDVAPAALLREVRAADPTGRYAMAVIALPRRERNDPQVLAIDTPRLAAVATWPAQTVTSPSAIATALHPSIPRPSAFTGTSVALDVDTTDYQTFYGDAYANPQAGRVGVFATFTLADGSRQIVVDLGDLRIGETTLHGDIPDCAAGCRFAGVTFKARQGDGLQMDAVVKDLAVDGVPVTLPWSDGSGWRVGGVGESGLPPAIAGDTNGLDVTMPELADIAGGVQVTLIDAPTTLPVVVAGSATPKIADADGDPMHATVTGSALPVLPGLGTTGAYVDLEYLTLAAPTNTTTAPGQVWLAASTPPSVVSALADAGVVTISDTTAGSELSYLDGQGPAIGMAFGLGAASVAVLLGAVCVVLMAGVERGGRAAELRTLRVQGLSASAARRSATVSHVGLVALATVAGCVVAATAWELTGRRLPLFTDGAHPDLPSTSAPWLALVGASLIGAIVLGVAAGVASRSLSRRVDD